MLTCFVFLVLQIKKSTNTIETEKTLDLARFCKVYRDLTKRYRRRTLSEGSSHDDCTTVITTYLKISKINCFPGTQ